MLAGDYKFPFTAVELLANDALPLPRTDRDVTVQIDIGPTAEASAGVTLHNIGPRRHLLPWRNQSSETQAWSIEQLLLLQHLKSQKARRC